MLCAQLAYMHRSQGLPGRVVTPTCSVFSAERPRAMGGDAEHILRAVLTRGAGAIRTKYPSYLRRGAV